MPILHVRSRVLRAIHSHRCATCTSDSSHEKLSVEIIRLIFTLYFLGHTGDLLHSHAPAISAICMCPLLSDDPISTCGSRLREFMPLLTPSRETYHAKDYSTHARVHMQSKMHARARVRPGACNFVHHGKVVRVTSLCLGLSISISLYLSGLLN